MNQIINMFLRLVMRKVMNKGIDAGIKGASGMAARRRKTGKNGDEDDIQQSATPERDRIRAERRAKRNNS